ncbi:hypothetical protein KIPB_003863 [Kipferlia bialata]|uniref:Uncharacterized protein n=1 Tax=Kipferlia bialata TaxID=797122 RepID=A0A391NKB5_9EUKA|nr:hypothetical protein KIPB_003863 [Kipferlia bialata]|eukprot:g3863.t1
MYFVVQVFFEETDRVSVWGYTSVDQCLLPVYLYASLLACYFSDTAREAVSKSVVSDADSECDSLVEAPLLRAPFKGSSVRLPPSEPLVYPRKKGITYDDTARLRGFKGALCRFWADINAAFREGSMFDTFMYRLFMNVKAILYAYFAIMYDTNMVYMQLNLMRTMLSWVGSLCLATIFPRVTHVSGLEQRRMLTPVYLLPKCLGSVLVCLALYWF